MAKKFDFLQNMSDADKAELLTQLQSSMPAKKTKTAKTTKSTAVATPSVTPTRTTGCAPDNNAYLKRSGIR